MIKTVILDFDGTIGDTCSLIVRTMQQTIAALDLPGRTDEECAAMIGLPLRQTFTDLIPMDEETAFKCEYTYRRLFDENNKPDAVPLFPNVKDTICALYSRGKTITIASSRGRDTLVDFLKAMGIYDYITYIIAATDIERAKPAPDMVIETLRNVGGKPEETIVVGDTRFDIEMGRSAGARTCGVTYGNGSRESLSDADYIIDDFGELLNIV